MSADSAMRTLHRLGPGNQSSSVEYPVTVRRDRRPRNGRRVPVQTFVEYREAGDPLNEFLIDFPSVTREQAVAVLELAKDLFLALAGGEDAGAAGVISSTVETSPARQGYAPNMDALRNEIAPPLVVVFKLEGTAMPVVLSLWIESPYSVIALNRYSRWSVA